MSGSGAIDLHNHSLPDAFIAEVETHPDVFGARVRRDAGGQRWLVYALGLEVPLTGGYAGVDARFADMDRADIEKMLMSFLPVDFFYRMPTSRALDACRLINDDLAAMARAHPDRILAMGTLPMQDGTAACRELDRCVRDLGMPAVQVGSIIAGKNLDEPQFYEVFEAAEALGVLVFVHPTHVVPGPGLSKYYLMNLIGNPLDTTIAAASLIFGGVLKRFPKLNFCLGHAGGTSPYLIGRWRHGARVRPETRAIHQDPFDDQLRRLYFDSITHSATALEFLIKAVGSDRVVVGTDYPADMGSTEQVSLIKGLPLTAEDRERIFRLNARTLLPRANLDDASHRASAPR